MFSFLSCVYLQHSFEHSCSDPGYYCNIFTDERYEQPIDLYRANAIRVLCTITDSGLLGQIERYLKQAVVDKNAVVSSAALVSGIHLLEVTYLVFPFLLEHLLNNRPSAG